MYAGINISRGIGLRKVSLVLELEGVIRLSVVTCVCVLLLKNPKVFIEKADIV